jgi:hypothetical protein
MQKPHRTYAKIAIVALESGDAIGLAIGQGLGLSYRLSYLARLRA